QTSLVLEGAAGQRNIAAIIDSLRNNPLKEINGIAVETIEDYELSISSNLQTGNKEDILLPKSNVLKYFLADGSWFCIRPSGTEPKMKYYYAVKGNSHTDSENQLQAMKQALTEKLNEVYKE